MQRFRVLPAIALLAFTSALCVAQGPTSAIDALPLDKTMRLIQDEMNAQGPLHYALYRYIANSDPALAKASEHVNSQIDVSQTGLNADSATCVIGFHSKEFTDFLGLTPNYLNETDQRVPLKSSNTTFFTTAMTPEMVSVTDGAHQRVLRGKMQRLPNILYRVDPQFFIVEVKATQSLSYEFYVHNQEDAGIVSQALQHAISLCNHLGKEVF